jgi:hypothetical protein
MNNNNIKTNKIINKSYLHICITNDTKKKVSETIDIEELQDDFNKINFHHFPTIKSSEFIYIPNKIEKVIYNFVSVKDLKEIDSDIEVAKEYIFLFLSRIVYSNYYRNLSIKYISNILFNESKTSTNNKVRLIINLLKKGTKNGPIIDVDESYIENVKARGYKLSSTYLNKGYKKYYFRTDKVKNQYRKYYYHKLSEAIENPIAKNLLNVYGLITLPTIEEIIIEGKKLVKTSYLTKKGKILKFRNKKSKEYDDPKYSYIEDSIEVFKYLTEDGYLLPTICGIDASFSLMPSWIRNLCKINGKQIVECDYTALHPNIAVMLFDGTNEYIKHENVANDLKITKNEVKIAHLSFFNQQVWQMKTNLVYPWYEKNEPEMLERIIKDKYIDGYKNITKKLFKIETNIMQSVIEKLNKKNIYVGYIYDALFCSPKVLNEVKKTMNETILEFGVYSIAK